MISKGEENSYLLKGHLLNLYARIKISNIKIDVIEINIQYLQIIYNKQYRMEFINSLEKLYLRN